MLKCERCAGDGKIVGMGGMTIKCETCQGVGFKSKSKAKKKSAKKDD